MPWGTTLFWCLSLVCTLLLETHLLYNVDVIKCGWKPFIFFWCYVSISKYLAEFHCLAHFQWCCPWRAGSAKQELVGMYLVLKMDDWIGARSWVVPSFQLRL